MRNSETMFFKSALLMLITVVLLVIVTPILSLLNRGLHIDNNLFKDLWISLFASITTSIVSSSTAVLAAIPISYYFSKYVRGLRRRILMSLITIPALMSPSAVGSLLLLFFTENPLGKLIDSTIGIVNDIKGVIVAQFVVVFPLAFSYLTALFANVPRVYEEVAMEVGLSRIGYLHRVLIPMTRSHVLSGYVLAFAKAFADFGASLVLGGGIRGRTWTLPIYIFAVTQFGDLTTLSSILLVYIIVVLLVYIAIASLEEKFSM